MLVTIYQTTRQLIQEYARTSNLTCYSTAHSVCNVPSDYVIGLPPVVRCCRLRVNSHILVSLRLNKKKVEWSHGLLQLWGSGTSTPAVSHSHGPGAPRWAPFKLLKYRQFHNSCVSRCPELVGTATGLQAERPRGRGSIPDRGNIFLFSMVSRRLRGPPSFLSSWYRGVKRPGREADYPPPPSTEVKNTWSCIYSPRYDFMAWCLTS
jgi:hypothetical protein